MILRLSPAPETILDIGIGHGKYGTLIREYLPEAWIVGIEPWEPYGDRDEPDGANDPAGARWWAYDVIVTNAWPEQAGQAAVRSILPRLDEGRYQLGLMIDVIEHYSPERTGPDGQAYHVTQRDALEALMRACDQVIVATPHDAMQWPQSDLDNSLERHYPAPKVGWLDQTVAQGQGMQLQECQWLADSYIACFG
jgi:hypothetical protein